MGNSLIQDKVISIYVHPKDLLLWYSQTVSIFWEFFCSVPVLHACRIRRTSIVLENCSDTVTVCRAAGVITEIRVFNPDIHMPKKVMTAI